MTNARPGGLIGWRRGSSSAGCPHPVQTTPGATVSSRVAVASTDGGVEDSRGDVTNQSKGVIGSSNGDCELAGLLT